MLKKIPHTYSIIFSIIIIAAALTWIIPAGEFIRHTENVNGVERTIIKSDSFHYINQSPQTWQIFSTLINGFEKQAGIIAFLLIIGGAFKILNAAKSIDIGIISFLGFTRGLEKNSFFKKIGVNNIVITMIMIIFSLFGAIFGMSEETLAFIIIIVPLAISMGYDSITGVCMVYVAAHIGFAGAILNPFTIGIAQGLSDIPLFSGIGYRMLCWFILTSIAIIFVIIYANRIKRNPQLSPTYKLDEYWRKRTYTSEDEANEKYDRLNIMGWGTVAIISISLLIYSYTHTFSIFSIGGTTTRLPMIPIFTAIYILSSILGLRKSFHYHIHLIVGMTIVFLVIGVMGHGWYLTEISALFLAMGLAVGFTANFKISQVISNFQEGAAEMLSTAIVVGLAGGIIRIMNDGHIIDTILFSLSSAMEESGRIASIGIMYAIQTAINIIIPSGSAKAALTMPIMAPFSDVIGISRQATVLAFQFGDGFTNMITPVSPVLIGALGIAKIPYELWVKWFYKFIIFLIIIGFILLLPTVLMNLDGF